MRYTKVMTSPLSSTCRGVAADVSGRSITHEAIQASGLWETAGFSKAAEVVGRRAAQTRRETLETGEGVERDGFIATAP